MSTITRDYVLLALAKEIDLCSFIRVSNFMATIAGGIYELEQKKVIELTKIQQDGSLKLLSGDDFSIKVKKELPSELSYLAVLYDVIQKSEKKTMHDVVKMMSFDVKTLYSNHYITDLIGSLVADGTVVEEKKKGLFGREKVEYKTNKDEITKMVKQMYSSIENDKIEEQDALVLYLILKTDMLDDYYNSKERALIKDKFETLKQSENAVKNVLSVIDDIILVLFGLLALLG